MPLTGGIIGICIGQGLEKYPEGPPRFGITASLGYSS